jgi:Protein of unknown function (DUF1573)
MNFRAVAAAVVCLAISVYAVVKLLGPGATTGQFNPNKVMETEPEGPEISKVGPFPKAEPDSTDFPFVTMVIGETRSHEFNVWNRGEAPLVIRMGATTCQCTYSDLKEGQERIVEPGKFEAIKLTWTPNIITESFSKGAEILTNDPQNRKISLRVSGAVRNNMSVFPPDEWTCEDLMDDKPGICTGMVVSGLLEKFNVTAVERRGVPVEFKLRPMEGDLLAKASHATSGFHVDVTVNPEMEMGFFSFPITIKTDVPDAREPADSGKMTEFEILVSGVRRGPIRFAGTPWSEEKMAITMGSFRVDEGVETSVSLFVRNPPEGGFQLTAPPECEPADLKVELTADHSGGNKIPRHQLKLSYPPNAPRVNHRTKNPGKIKLQTNHPAAKTIEIQVYLNSQ